jgi:hypothetical protein
MRIRPKLLRRPWKRTATQEQRDQAEELRLERVAARLRSRREGIQAESRHRSRSGFGGPG